MLKETTGINKYLLIIVEKSECQPPSGNYFFPIRVRKGEPWSWMIRRKDPQCSSKKGKLFSFKLKRRQVQCTPVPQPLHGVYAHVPGGTRPREENPNWKGIEELVWHSTEAPPWISTYKSSPSYKRQGGRGVVRGILRPVLPLVLQVWVLRERSGAADEGGKVSGQKGVSGSYCDEP